MHDTALRRPRPFWMPGGTRKAAYGTLIVYLLLVGLLAVTLIGGMKGVSLVRPLFILGCVFVAWRAWRVRPGLHVEVTVVLFTLAPLLRRAVDLYVGYNASGIMLVGPLLALAIPLSALGGLVSDRKRDFKVFMPYLLMTICIVYGWSLAAFQNRLLEATVDAVKAIVPMLYAVYLIQRNDDCEEIIQGAARAFFYISPLIGCYGVFQYLHPLEWDRYWMIYSQMKSIGLPEARQIRVFSTMNSPASFAMFAACGLMLFSFCRRGWLPFFLVLPTGIALLLTSVRTAWIILAVGTLFCALFSATRGRAVGLTLCLLGVIAVALLLTPASELISQRLATMGSDPAQDGSAHARWREYIYIYSNLDQYLFGTGFGNIVHDPRLENTDGQFVSSAAAMGIFVGDIYIIGIAWAGAQGLFRIRSDEQPIRLVAAAMLLGYLLVMPLLVVTAGEVSFLFWMFVGLMPTSRSAVSANAGHRSPSGVMAFRA